MGVERKHQHILNVARALMLQSHIPSNFWSYAIKHVVYLINQVPSPINWNKTPFELLRNQIPNLKVFGCLAYASTYMTIHHKFDPRSRREAFLGFQNGTKGHVIMDLGTKEIFVSRHVIFHEMTLPFANKDALTTTKKFTLSTGPTIVPT